MYGKQKAAHGDIRLIVGLGNPGEEYANTRHNAGFIAAGTLANGLGARYWKTECGSLCAHVPYRDERHDLEVIIAKPQSFMNASGGPVAQLVKKYGIPVDKLIVVHDDLDVPHMDMRIKFGGGTAGHNGLKSICEKMGTRDFIRVRIGIGRPPGRMPVSDYVLSAPKSGSDEADEFRWTCDMAAHICEELLTHTVQQAQNEWNNRYKR